MPLRSSLVHYTALCTAFAMIVGSYVIAPTQAGAAPQYNGKIVTFSDNSAGPDNIYIMDEDGGNHTLISDNLSENRYPKWSPNGTKIAFQSNRDGDFDIYTMDPDGGNVTQLTNIVGDEQDVQWSPDGTKLLFRSGLYGNRNFYVINANGTGQTSLTNTADNFDGRWSPDGAKIVFSTNRHGSYEIYSMLADGTNKTRLTADGFTNYAPRWSPDGSKIVYESYRGASKDLYSMDANGANDLAITNTSSFEEIGASVSFSPDGSKVSFSRLNQIGDRGVLVTSRLDGTNQTLHNFNTQGIPIVDTTIWSPDSTKILFTGYTQTDWSVSNLYQVNADGTGLTPLTSDGMTEYGDWLIVNNQPPVVANDSLGLAYNTTGIADVLANDVDEEGSFNDDYLTVDTPPTFGTATVVNGKISYTPNPGHKGSDQLTYQICDSFILNQLCSTATLNITVASPDAPTLMLTSIDDITYESSIGTYSITNSRPTFAGTASAGATINLVINSDPITFSTTAESNGTWSGRPATDIPWGDHTVSITATLEGETSTLSSFVLSVTQAPVATTVTAAPEIPLTGAYAVWLRVAGIGLLALGGGGLMRGRRNKNSPYAAPPQLWT